MMFHIIWVVGVGFNHFSSFIVGLILFSGYLLKRDFASNRNIMIFLPVFVVFQAVSVPAFIISYDREVNLREIVVLDENIILFEVPEDSGKREAQIYEGNKLRILNDISGWYLVKLSNGKEGWIIKKGVAGI
ncbi:MAG: SH3 domain-containing protein [Ignavibacteriales bacterium]|nr:SH3 domain-containing protein [Ignavibacteriales bacterium]